MCTWRGCRSDGFFPQRDTEGQEFAILCFRHAQELAAAMDSHDFARIVFAFVRAQGGEVGSA